MVFASTLRSVFGGSHGGLIKSAHHTHTTVADPNSLIAAKKCAISRLFTSTCPVRQATKESANTSAQQQQCLTSTANPDSAFVPFHIHSGNTARTALGLRGIVAHQSVQPPSLFLRPRRIRYKFFRCNCPALFVGGVRRHLLACREGEQHAEEEEADEPGQASGYTWRFFGKEQLWPSIIIQECKQGQSADESSQLIVTSSSPVYQQLVQSLASNSSSAFKHSFCGVMSSSLPSLSASPVTRDLPDEKNNDHIPLPTISHTVVQTIEECGDRYTGQLCPLTSQQHGRGVMQYVNGESYAGEWEYGLQHGKGVMCYNGGRYSGEYARGERCGTGVWQSDDGNKYDGEWKAGARHGRGKEWQNDELIYDGEWVANARHGYGVAQSAAGGWRYEGEWVNGVMDGYGSIEYSNGEVWEGQWHAGAMHGEGMRISSTGSSQLETCQHGSLISSQVQPLSPRQSSEGMGSLDASSVMDESTTAVEGVPNTQLELLSLLSQVASLQSVLVNKLSRVEELLQPATTNGQQAVTLPHPMGAVSMAA